MNGIQFRYLTQEQVIQLGGLDMNQAVQDIEEVFRLFASGQAIVPNKVVLRWGDVDSESTRGRINGMPGYIGGKFDMAGIKWIASMPLNPFQHDAPRASALTILNDPTLGFPLAVMDGTVISAVRTGAVSGVAAKYLAREDARTVGIIGAGVQSRTQLMALQIARPALSTCYVFDIREDRTNAWCDDMRKRAGMTFVPVASAREATQRADILVSATTASEPVVKTGWIHEGMLYCHVGGHECEAEAIREFDRIVADNWSEIQHRGGQALALAKEQGILRDEDISAELGDVVVGRKPGRQNDRETVFFSSVGMGVEDIAIASRILRLAEEQNVGTVLPLWENPAFM